MTDNQIDLLKAAREAAEEVVEGMPDGPTKAKAYELAFERILGEGNQKSAPGPKTRRRATKKAPKAGGSRSTRSRRGPGLTVCVREAISSGYFKQRRTDSEVVDHLGVSGHRFARGSVAATLLRLVQQNELKRHEEQRDGKTVLVYEA